MKNLAAMLCGILILLSCVKDSPTSSTSSDSIVKNVFCPVKITLYSVGKSPKTILFTHDEKGRIVREWMENTYQILRTYDDLDHETAVLTQMWRDGVWQDSLLLTRLYDMAGNLLVYTDKHIVEGRKYMSTYEYNNGKFSSGHITESYNSDSLNYSYRETDTRSSTGKLLSYVSEKLKNGAWENDQSSTYSYDVYEHCTGWTLQSWLNGAWVNYLRAFYQFDEFGNKVEEETQIWANNGWVAWSKSHIVYNRNGKLLNYTIISWDNGNYTDSSFGQLEYDASGNCTSDFSETFENGVLKYGSKTTTVYDSYGNEIAEEEMSLNNGSWQYDNSGIVLRYLNGSYSATSCYRMEAEYEKL
jgi:hypothetical protein